MTYVSRISEHLYPCFQHHLRRETYTHNPRAASTFFSLGQVLPTHRASHSPHGGAFQSTIPQAIRLLSAQPFVSRQPGSLDAASKTPGPNEVPDPFTSGDGLTYSTDGTDSFIAPSTYAQNRMAWVRK